MPQDALIGAKVREKSTSSAEIRINGISGRLYAHAAKDCDHEILWEEAKPIRMEKNWKQRKVKESVESYKREMEGKTVLNICDTLDVKWKRVIEKRYGGRRSERENI